MSGAMASQPPELRLYVSMSTVPGRERVVRVAVDSWLQQRRPPDRLLVVAPRNYSNRFAGSSVNISAILPRHPLIEARYCATDSGPGTKLLCALPRALALCGAIPSCWLVLADDDRTYKDWALQELEAAMLAAAEPIGLSFYLDRVWLPHAHSECYGPCVCSTLPRTTASACHGRKCCFGRQFLRSQFVTRVESTPTLVLGQGADLLAMPLGAARGAPAFFRCAVASNFLISRHDDFWISAFLSLRHDLRTRQSRTRGARLLQCTEHH